MIWTTRGRREGGGDDITRRGGRGRGEWKGKARLGAGEGPEKGQARCRRPPPPASMVGEREGAGVACVEGAKGRRRLPNSYEGTPVRIQGNFRLRASELGVKGISGYARRN